MKKKKNKQPKVANQQKIERMRDGVRERSSTWGGKKDPKRSEIKNRLRNYRDGQDSSFLIYTHIRESLYGQFQEFRH
jgi:hypothetical protein